MTLSRQALRRRVIDHASARYRAAGRFAYHFARGKLAGDPVFWELLERGLFPASARILDLGCGKGLLAACLLSARRLYDAGEWPTELPAPPKIAGIRGVDLSAKDVRLAQLALGGPAQFEAGDMRHVEFGQADVVVIMDAVHYLDRRAQDDVLQRVRAALRPNGLLLTRVGDAGGGLGFQFSKWVDRSVAFFRGMGLSRLHCRRLSEWVQALEALGFCVDTAPMNGALPLANIMLVARLDEKVKPRV